MSVEGREVKKNVENEINEASASNNDSSLNSHGGDFEMVHGGRMQLLLLSRLRVLVKFLLFREDNPKHFVWTNPHPICIGLVFTLSVFPGVMLMLAGYKFWGVLGFFVAYVIACVLPLEILHCIFDR